MARRKKTVKRRRFFKTGLFGEDLVADRRRKKKREMHRKRINRRIRKYETAIRKLRRQKARIY